MHKESRDFTISNPNGRGLSWCNQMQSHLTPFLDNRQRSLLRAELLFQKLIQATQSYHLLPKGPIHGDLFRDNVLFQDGLLSGVLDFYFSATDVLVLDVAICLNDWCVDHRNGKDDQQRVDKFLAGYQSERRLELQEITLLPAMRRAGALRFWVSRLIDLNIPREASHVIQHDPRQFEQMLAI